MPTRRIAVLAAALTLAFPAAAAAAPPICSPATCSEQGQSRSISLKRSSWDKKTPKASTSRTKGRKTSLRVSIKFAPKGSKPRVTVTGPKRFKRVISKSTTFRNARPGTYKVVARSIDGKDVTTFATYQSTRAKLRKGVAGWVGVRYMQRVENTTRIADPSAIEAVSGDPNGVRDIVVEDPAGLVQPGTVLIAGVGPQTPGGMLVEVASVTRSGTKTIARGGPAPLTAIGPQAEIVSEPKLKMSAEEFQDAVADGASGHAFKRMLPGDGPKAFAAAKKTKGFDRPYACSGGVKATLGGDVSFDADASVGVAWGGWLKPLTIQAYAGVKLQQSSKLEVALEGAAKCSLDLNLLPEDHRFTPWTFSIGPVPVVIVPKLNFEVTGEASIGARLSTYVEQTLTTEFGVQWDGSRISPYGKADATFKTYKPNPSGTLNLKAAVGPKLAFDLYDVAGPYLTADLFMQLKADTNKDPWWRLSGGLQAGGGLRFKVWKIEFDKGIRDIWSEDWTIAQADNPPVPSFTTTTLPDADNGKAYSSKVVATSKRGPLSYALNAGRLPSGLKLETDGRITGTATGYGTSTFEVAAKDSLGQKGLQSFTVKTKTPPATITTTALPAGTTGTHYSAKLVAGGAVAPYSWSVSAGALPAGLQLSGDTIAGTPTHAETATFTVKVAGVDGNTATRQLSIAVEPPPLGVTTSSLPGGKAYVAYAAQTLAATGGRGPYTWSATGVPAGLTLGADGVLAGTPTGPSTTPLAVTVKDADGRTASVSLALTIQDVDPLTITTSALPAGMQDVAYDQTLSAVGGRAPYTFTAAPSSVPAGLTLAAGKLSGTPTVPGTSQVALTVTDVDGRTAAKTLALRILPPGTEITTSSLPTGQRDEVYEAQLAVLGGTAPYTWSITSGTLHTGLTLDPATGEITGTPTAGGNKSITFRVVGADNVPATKTLSLNVSSTLGRPIDDVSCATPDFCVGIDRDKNSYVRDASGTWSGAISTGTALTTPRVSCGAVNACVMTVITGATFLFDGTTWTPGPTIPNNLAVYDVDCATSTYCVAAGRSSTGYSSVWEWDGSAWGPFIQIAPGNGWVVVNCPAVDDCVLGGNPGTATFNGTTGTTTGSFTPAENGASYLSCLTPSRCFAGGQTAGNWSFNGTAWSSLNVLDGTYGLRTSPIGCSRTADLCAAGDSPYGDDGLWTYDGTSWTRHPDTASGYASGAACAGSSFCLGVTSRGQSRTWNGTSWSSLKTFARGV